MAEAESSQFTRGAIRPLECLREGWELVRDQYWLFTGICAVGMLLASAIPLILVGPMFCGIYMCYLARLRGEPVDFNRLFKGFDYFQPGLVVAALMVLVALVVVLPLALAFSGAIIVLPIAAAGGGGAEWAFGAMLLACLLFGLIIAGVGTLVGMFFLYAFILIVDRGLSGVAAARLGARAAWANLGGTFGVVLLQMVLGLLGACVFYIGAFLVLPVTMGAVVAAYRRFFPELAPAVAMGHQGAPRP